MSLSVRLEYEKPMGVVYGHKIYVREDGQTRELTFDEWKEKYPDAEPVIYEGEFDTREVHWGNITHNLNKMADEAGIYKCLWRPEEIDIIYAHQLIEPLEKGLDLLLSDPDHFKQFNPPNGWGDYDGLVRFVTQYLSACKSHPGTRIRASR